MGQKHIMNKDVKHDGKDHKKGSEISPDSAAFKALKSQGHVDSIGDAEGKAEGEESGEGEGQQSGKQRGRR